MLKGHPKGLYALFLTEMWERLAFYLLLGILVLYAIDTERGGLGLSITAAAEIYGTYLAFVYFTPFLGGLIADRYLGYRRSVFIGGLLMAAGLFMLGVRSMTAFYGGLTLICVGNGFFKPNISAMVGNLYEPGDPKRDTGFNIFYMGINVGASLSALLSAPLRNTWDFNVAFMGAGVGLLIGVTVLLINWKKLEAADRQPEMGPDDIGLGTVALAILLPAAIFGTIGYFVGENVELISNSIGSITFAFIVGMLPIIAYFLFIVVKASPEEKPGLGALIPVYVAGGAFFMILHLSGGLMTFFAEQNTSRKGEWIPSVVQQYYSQKAMPSYYDNADADLPRPDEDTLIKVDAQTESMFGQKRISEEALARVQQQYSDLKFLANDDPQVQSDWGFLSCGVYENSLVEVKTATDAHGMETVSVSVPESADPLSEGILVRTLSGATFPVLLVSDETFASVFEGASAIRMEPGTFLGLMNAELITGLLNPVFVVLFTPLVVAFFMWRVKSGKEISTARKIFYGMFITTVALLIMAFAAYTGKDGDSKVSVLWLVLFYGVITVGELCLSPMGLSLVTKLAPKRLVGLMMGGWFLSTSIGNKLSGFISGLPASTMMFLILGGAIFLVAMFIFVLLPTLDRAIKKYGA